MSSDWELNGCKNCKESILSGNYPPPEEIAISEGPIFLHKCNFCGSYWEINLREAHVIDLKEAQEKFPQAFHS